MTALTWPEVIDSSIYHDHLKIHMEPQQRCIYMLPNNLQTNSNLPAEITILCAVHLSAVTIVEDHEELQSALTDVLNQGDIDQELPLTARNGDGGLRTTRLVRKFFQWKFLFAPNEILTIWSLQLYKFIRSAPLIRLATIWSRAKDTQYLWRHLAHHVLTFSMLRYIYSNFV